MDIAGMINKPLSWAGLKLTRLSAVQKLQEIQPAVQSDILRNSGFMDIYQQVKPYTLVSIERAYALYQSVAYILKNRIPGDFVECGVWRGGSCMQLALQLIQSGALDRTIWMYDTFKGMTKPGPEDGEAEKREWAAREITPGHSDWCLSGLDEVRKNMFATGYPAGQIRFVEGPVEDTIPGNCPASIALLRLDTDWYASTLHELTQLYPLLQTGGVLLIDDYGAWEGAQKATDEYFGQQDNIYLHRIDYTGRLLIKSK